MSGRSTIETIHLPPILMEKYMKRGKDMHIIFIDLEKVYDSVPHSVIWTSVESKSVSWIYVRVIQKMYSQVMPCVRIPVSNIQYFPFEI